MFCRAVALLVALCPLGGALAQGGGPDGGSGDVPTDGLRAALEEATIVTRDLRVLEGDTFVRIARREYGSAALARPLAEFNEIPFDAPLAAGQIVRLPILVPARGETALVVFVKGAVRRATLALERGDLLAAGDEIRTGSDGFASIQFSSGSIVNLQPDTEATIERLACLESDDSCVVDIGTRRGELVLDVENRDDQPLEFRVTTPFASAAVRGTEFDVLLGEGELRACGDRRGARRRGAAARASMLESGFGSLTREGEAPGQALPLPPSPVLRTVPARAAAGEAVVWFPLTGSVRYEALLSLDEAGLQTRGRLLGRGVERLEIPDGIEPEDYYLTLRGVDANGLPGFRSVARLGLVDVDESVAPVEVTHRAGGPGLPRRGDRSRSRGGGLRDPGVDERDLRGSALGRRRGDRAGGAPGRHRHRSTRGRAR